MKTLGGWRVIVVGGHTRNIGKTQLVCDIIAEFPEVEWVAGKITQYGHGVCAQSVEGCSCAPMEHASAISWEKPPGSATDSGRFLTAGASHSFWLRTKQGLLAEGLPDLREGLESVRTGVCRPQALIVESNSVMQYVDPELYVVVLDPAREDFKGSAKVALDRADFVVIHDTGTREGGERNEPAWAESAARLTRGVPTVPQRIGEKLPETLVKAVRLYALAQSV